MILEMLYALGNTLLMVGVLPFMSDVFHSLALMTGVSVLPGFLRITLRSVGDLRIPQLVGDIFAFLVQVLCYN